MSGASAQIEAGAVGQSIYADRPGRIVLAWKAEATPDIPSPGGVVSPTEEDCGGVHGLMAAPV